MVLVPTLLGEGERVKIIGYESERVKLVITQLGSGEKRLNNMDRDKESKRDKQRKKEKKNSKKIWKETIREKIVERQSYGAMEERQRERLFSRGR